MSFSKAIILGAAGLCLTNEEVYLYRSERPWGFILFARNIADADQVRTLIAEMRETVGRPDAPVFIDQEGGRVQRLRPPLAPNYPDAGRLGALYEADNAAGLRATWLMSRLHAYDLTKLGINGNCMPVLDVPVAGAHDVIGNRAYSADPYKVAAMGRAASDGLMAGGVLPVMKHIPGHGRAGVDSHKELPKVDSSLETLEACDFIPFIHLKDLPLAMTAHIVYSSIDPDHPATTSSRIVTDIIREKIGFDGLLMSDDVSMHALSGEFSARVDAIIAAGCDIVLHCNGVMKEMREVAERAPVLSGRSKQRAEKAINAISGPDDLEEILVREEFLSYFPLEA